MTEKEFLNLINQHGGIINKIIYLYVDNPEDKRDIRQEIILQAWKSMPNFKGNSSFSTWLYRVALNTALTFRRKDKSGMISSIDDLEFSEKQKAEHDKSELLLRVIRQLNDIDKSIITMHLEDYDNQEISDILGLSKNNVAVKLHRIKENISRKLKPAANHG